MALRVVDAKQNPATLPGTMPGYRSSFGRGLLIGAGAATMWAVARYYGRKSQSENRLIDWDRATRIAVRTCGDDADLAPTEKARLQDEYEEMVSGIEGPISQYTGTVLPLGDTAIQVMDRADWVRTNVGNFRQLFAPIEELYADTSRQSPLGTPLMADASRLFLSAQAGLLIGYLARKVLGQYDLSLLGKEPLTPGKLYFVEPNIKAIERSLKLPPTELRLWIALHEATHAHEFEVNPWVRTYLNEHLQTYLRTVVDDMRNGASPGRMGVFVSRLVNNLRQGHNFIEALMTPEQRAVLSELQALMSLAEGYSNHVMNNVGSRLLPHFDEIHAAVERRQKQRGQAEELFLRLTGLKMKMEQYALGEKFATQVADERGVEFLNRAWQAPEHLPTEDEIRTPQRWIARLEQLAA
jgi:coenzyme F420 biosynthesis associated uncharacterized protein